MNESAKDPARARGRESSAALERGLQVLTTLADHPEGLTVTELAAAIRLSRPVVYRLLAVLLDRRYVRRDPDGRLALGVGLLGLAQRAQPHLRRVAVPVLRELAERVGATAHLSVADGAEATAVSVVEPSWTDLHVAYRVGSRHPLDRGAAGRAILAARSGRRDLVESVGELQPGAYGVALAVPTEALEASVGLVALAEFDRREAGEALRAAADRLARLLE
jgi:DNA-binding transcriptional ArsR family regulator